MIIELLTIVPVDLARQLAKKFQAILVEYPGECLLVTNASVKEIPKSLRGMAKAVYPMESDLQLGSRAYRAQTRHIQLSETLAIGGNTGHTLMISGPCSVESEEQITQSAEFVQSLGIQVLRGGCYKPRTSPYSFQGLGVEGLKLLAKMREQFGLLVITEVRDATQIEEVIEYTDIVQIGAKAMYDQGILRRCGTAGKPILLKRGFGSTLQEFAQAAEFILSGGNPDVMLCERGIRTFETKTRFTLDLCGVAWLKEYTNLPVILDTSHAMGYRYGVPDLTRACTAMGVDGLLVETHPNPAVAKSDAAQQLDFPAFKAMYESLKPIAAAVGRKLV